ncbi:hypothetical protein B0H19DRAFT_1081766 [Mycena capillaripes]|nr:hypothetical protein B0H19DRAFT_1081766 [Mycena capillaripes]
MPCSALPGRISVVSLVEIPPKEPFFRSRVRAIFILWSGGTPYKLIRLAHLRSSNLASKQANMNRQRHRTSLIFQINDATGQPASSSPVPGAFTLLYACLACLPAVDSCIRGRRRVPAARKEKARAVAEPQNNPNLTGLTEHSVVWGLVFPAPASSMGQSNGTNAHELLDAMRILLFLKHHSDALHTLPWTSLTARLRRNFRTFSCLDSDGPRVATSDSTSDDTQPVPGCAWLRSLPSPSIF